MALITVSSSNVFATEVSDSVISSEAIETASTGSGSFTNSATVQFILMLTFGYLHQKLCLKQHFQSMVILIQNTKLKL